MTQLPRVSSPRRFGSHADWPVRAVPGVLLVLWTLAPALAAGPAAHERTTVIEARYQAERQDCLQGRSHQDRGTCLKEASAARAEALRHRLDNGEDAATLQANALARCDVQLPAERTDCEQLARGQGVASGSVHEGGVMRQRVTRAVAMPAEPARPASPASAAARAAPASAPSIHPEPSR